MSIYVGTTDWEFDEWNSSFYPHDLRKMDFLSYYASKFNTVEVSGTFYKLPYKNHLRVWHMNVGEDFVFSTKLTWKISHKFAFRVDEKSSKVIDSYFDRIANLKNKVRNIIIKPSPKLHFDQNDLSNFMNSLPQNYKYVFEATDGDWASDTFSDYCRTNKYTMLSQYNRKVQILNPGNDLYLRLDGKYDDNRYLYDESELKEIAEAIKEMNYQDTFIYFNNFHQGNAALNAETMKSLIQ